MTSDQRRSLRAIERRAHESEIRAMRWRRAAENIETMDPIELRAMTGDVTWAVAGSSTGWSAIAYGIYGAGATPTAAIADWLLCAAAKELETARRLIHDCADMTLAGQ